jgi:arylsulfatase A-like enzyme
MREVKRNQQVEGSMQHVGKAGPDTGEASFRWHGNPFPFWPRGARLAGLLSALGMAVGANLAAAESASVPARSALIVTIDTLRADHVGALGGPVATPVLDGLAREGALLLQATTPMPSTGPAHASLFSGLHPWRHGALDNAVAPAPDMPHLAVEARAAGLRTGAFVSSFILDRRFGFDRGFETWWFEPSEPYTWRGRLHPGFWTRGEHTVDAALRWLGERGRERFLLWVHLFDPHSPYQAPPGYALPPDAPVDLRNKSVPAGVRNRGELASAIRAYRAEVRYVDAQVGRLAAALRDAGRGDDTLLVVTADHGEALGDHGVLEHGFTVYDELVRVPLIVRGPGIAPGRRLDGPAQLEDLAPTLRAWLGLAPAKDLDGVDLGPWLRGARAESPRAVALGRRKPYPNQPDLFFARRHPLKWIGARGAAAREFDLASDPNEQAGRSAAAPPEALRALLSGADPERPTPPLDAETKRALEALGYTR